MTTVVVMKIQVAPDREAEFENLVAERSHGHLGTQGFERAYLLRLREGREYRLVSWWSQLENPEAFVRKETYALSENSKHPGLLTGPVPHEVLDIAQRVDGRAHVAGNA